MLSTINIRTSDLSIKKYKIEKFKKNCESPREKCNRRMGKYFRRYFKEYIQMEINMLKSSSISFLIKEENCNCNEEPLNRTSDWKKFDSLTIGKTWWKCREIGTHIKYWYEYKLFNYLGHLFGIISQSHRCAYCTT